MKRSLLLYLLLILAPAVVLAVIAVGVADRDFDEGVRRLAERVEEEADALARRIDGALGDAAARAAVVLDAADAAHRAGDTSALGEYVGYARAGRWLGYWPFEPETESVDADTARFFELSSRGGRSWELRHGDPERALDAYSFYLPRVREPRLGDRLRFGAARAALACGKRALGVEMLADLATSDSLALTDEGLPVALLAALRLREEAPGRVDGARLTALLAAHAPRLSTERLAGFVASIPVSESAPADARLAAAVASRRELERIVAAAPEVLETAPAALRDGSLVVARRLDGGLRGVTRAPVLLPELEAGGLTARLVEGTDLVATAPESPVATRPLHAGSADAVVGTLVVEDPGRDTALAELESRRSLARWLVGLLVVVTLAGGAALVLSMMRERRLVALRANLLANVSHELKTPVTSIRMFSEMLAESPFDANRTRRFGHLLLSESLRLIRIIENVLDFARLGRDETELEREPVDLRALVERVSEGFAYRAGEREADFAVEGLESPPEGEASELVVVTNAPAVERILVNLLDNALKYRAERSLRIRMRVARRGDGSVDVAVEDNGVGVPAADRERIFEEFYRARFEDYGVQGSGLGLSIARGLARRLGGDVTVASEVGEGSTFTLALPGAEEDAADTGDDDAAQAPREDTGPAAGDDGDGDAGAPPTTARESHDRSRTHQGTHTGRRG